MSKTKFTKGEWTIVDSTDKSLSVWASESECIATINYDFWDEKYQDELKANTHLIAAAPAMYAVIEQIVRYQRSNKGELQEYMNNSKLSFEKLLAKARGE